MKTPLYLLLISMICITLNTQAMYFRMKTHYRVCFTPQEPCTKLLIHTIRKARNSIYVQAYTFTQWRIAKALIQAHKRGVKVHIILDKSQFKDRHCQITNYLMHHNIPVWRDDNFNIAHNKVMIIDQSTIETGSFNYTVSAQKYNAENMLIIDSHQLAKRYLHNWKERRRLSQRLYPSHFKT